MGQEEDRASNRKTAPRHCVPQMNPRSRRSAGPARRGCSGGSYGAVTRYQSRRPGTIPRSIHSSRAQTGPVGSQSLFVRAVARGYRPDSPPDLVDTSKRVGAAEFKVLGLSVDLFSQ
jgi:hypothetical protein